MRANELLSTHSLVVTDLTVSYNRVPALHHISFQVCCGQSVALLGPNGAGKSTLLKTLAGLVQRESGTVRFHGRDIQGATQDFAYLPQRGLIDWDFPTTVRGLVEMGRYMRLGWYRSYGKADEDAVSQAIASMALEDLEDRQISALSGGQQQRAFLARALAQQAHVVLLDEPFTGLDKPNQDKLQALIRQLREQGKLVIASHHDLASVAAVFDQAILLNGELIASGPVDEVLHPEHLDRTYSTRVFSGPVRHTHAHAHSHASSSEVQGKAD